MQIQKVAVRTYAVRVLPLADYTMINSINPVFFILLMNLIYSYVYITAVRLHVYLVFVKSIEQGLKIQ